MNVKITNSLPGKFIAAIMLFYGITLYTEGLIRDSYSLMAYVDWIPFDSIQYVKNGENFSLDSQDVIALLGGSLNFLSLSYLYSFFNDLIIGGALAFLIINCFCLYLIITWGAPSASLGGRLQSRDFWAYAFIFMAFSPFLIGWVIVPNKELLVATAMLGALRAIELDKKLQLFLLCAAAGFIKVQFVITLIIFFIGKSTKLRKFYLLLGISIFYPVLYRLFPGLQMDHFVYVNSNEIRTANIFLGIDSWSQYPLGYMLIFPLRLLLNTFGGLFPARLIESGFSLSAIAPLTSLFLGIILLVAFGCAIIRNDWRLFLYSKSDKSLFLFSYLAVNLSLPFLQPRYYWWLVPILLSYIMFGGRRKAAVSK